MSTDLTLTPAAATGLTEAEALQRRRDGRGNDTGTRPSRSYTQVLRANVFTFYNNILFVIGTTLLALGRTNDAFISVGLGMLNAVISSVQEMRAKRTLDRLRLLHRGGCTVLRDGQERTVPAEEAVEGDVLRLRAGDQVVVDGPVVGPGSLEVDESLLTGEADPVTRTTGDRLLSGSYCVGGGALQLADAVGDASHAASLTRAARSWVPRRTPLQLQIDLVLRLVMVLTVLISAAVLLSAALQDLPFVRLVQAAAVLTGLVPYGLFFLVTVAYATGAASLAGQGALVQQLNAVESLSNVDVVCTDKTGTLTTGRLTLQEVVPTRGAGAEAQVRAVLGHLARSATSSTATTSALAAVLPGAAVPVRAEVAFSSARRWSALAGTAAPLDGVFVLGAYDALLPALTDGLDDGLDDGLATAVDERTRRGERVLLLARAVDGRAALRDADDRPVLPLLSPIALVVLADELRPHARESVADFTGRGVAVKVISGDDPRTVAAVAAQVGLHDDEPLSGAALDAMDAAGLEEAVDRHSVFGRIAPEQKERIVDALRHRGRYVAMIGDGVNDTRSLKKAHVGIAMASGSSVTRDVADIVLVDDSFAALGAAQQHGRRIIGGIGVSLCLFLPRVLTAMLAIVAVSMLGLGFPYEPAQVGLTLFTVGVPSLLMTAWARPAPPDRRMLGRIARFVLPAGVVTAVFAVALYTVAYTLVRSGLREGLVPLDAVQRFEAYTGVAGGDDSFVALASVGVAQTALSSFTSVTAFALLLFLEPPSRLFTGWASVSSDKRPALLALGLLTTLFAVLLTPPLADYFQLLRPGGFMLPMVALTTVLWFFTLRACWRHRLLDRLLGPPRP